MTIFTNYINIYTLYIDNIYTLYIQINLKAKVATKSLLSLAPSCKSEIFGQQLIVLPGLTENLLCAESKNACTLYGWQNKHKMHFFSRKLKSSSEKEKKAKP